MSAVKDLTTAYYLIHSGHRSGLEPAIAEGLNLLWVTIKKLKKEESDG